MKIGVSIFHLVLVAVLAGCGGSATISGDRTITPADVALGQTTLDSFSDGSAIVRVVSGDDRVPAAAVSTVYTVSTVRVPDAEIPEESPLQIRTTDLSRLTATEFGEVYTGEVLLNGTSYDVRMFTDSSSSVELISAFDATSNEKYTIVTGDLVSNIPSGDIEYTFTGQNLVSATNNEDFEAGGGSFSMAVNFSNMNGSLTATSATSMTTLTGAFAIDTNTGYFSGENLVLNAPNLQPDTPAVISGSFHGDGALGVSALYYDKSDTPLVNGAIIGSRSANGSN